MKLLAFALLLSTASAAHAEDFMAIFDCGAYRLNRVSSAYSNSSNENFDYVQDAKGQDVPNFTSTPRGVVPVQIISIDGKQLNLTCTLVSEGPNGG